ncbi:MAG: hypothetical protein A2475_12945 [Ignavibacteria bacterium RIFOXYC2_FULL_35_21]|nr:MAG: hypothetical protein A2220_00235 [Ignavibacteria bacterium RIFOXYA2_FULL_35_10]OGV18883.1 MAG: hypothetical protein A2475_12945 [Ignavibacteria bacterium RIFOXYC2_FULL_35_21]
MEIEQIMIDYFEGDTTTELERKMFSQMSLDDSLIVEFKNFYLINNAMKASVNSFTSPPSVTNEIFRKLGYSIPPAAKPKWVLFSFLKNHRALSHILSSIATSALTVVIMLLFFFPEANDNILTAKQSTNKVTQGFSSSLPVVTSKENTVNPAVKQKHKYQASSFANTEDNVIVEHPISTQASEENLILPSAVPVSDYKITNVPSAISSLHYADNNLNEAYLFSYREPLGLSLGFSGLAMWDIPKATIPLNYISPFNNNAISIYYDLSDNIKIGAELRQETFYTEYTGKELNDTLYLYNQQTNLTTFSANARFYLYDFGSFCSYFGSNIGINKGGFIARPNAGIEYQVYPDLAFALGFEYSYFYYHHLNVWTGNSKVGINYGILVKF